ncbi:hypothetical protein K0U07_05975 [bacterium]|nr:hypothetical protein [bacterium]
MLLSIVLSILRRKKWALLWAVFSLAMCNAVFFTASVQKEKLLRLYTARGEVLSDGDVILLSSESKDVLHPKAFEFPHMENVMSHKEVTGIASLVLEGEEFVPGGECPELIMISLRKGASINKWVDTLQSRPDYVAVHSSQYRRLYNKAILLRNKALNGHYSLLSSIAFFSFFATILFAANLVCKVRNEMGALLQEGIKVTPLILWFGFCLSKIAGITTFLVCLLQLFMAPFLELLVKLYIQVCFVELTTIFITVSLILMVKRRGIWAK